MNVTVCDRCRKPFIEGGYMQWFPGDGEHYHQACWDKNPRRVSAKTLRKNKSEIGLRLNVRP